MQLSRFQQIIGRPAWPETLAEPERLGIAVSGGGDSVALLHGLAEHFPAARLHVVTVDHGLRAASAQEAAGVAALCARLGLPHRVLRWQGWDGQGNLQDAARRARRRLIADWARTEGLSAVALGHTRDDQAETLLMRLERGSGVDGLAAMAPESRSDGITWLRPLLAVGRADLRRYLAAIGADWVEDPSNEDTRFARVRARHAIATLGLRAERLAETAQAMARARAALAHLAHETAQRIARVQGGDVLFDAAGLAVSPEETRLRLLAHALCWVSSAEYRPRLQALQAAHEAARQGRRRTLHGCLLLPEGPRLRICREPAAVAAQSCAAPGPWDGRWVVQGPWEPGDRLAPLGETGLAQCENRHVTGMPRASLLASPALWRGETLLCAPLAGHGPAGAIGLLGGEAGFFASILSH
ncbi:tRNA(Ile)-lysidine synthase [Pseudoruegeria aquimaris]|uniref:tRNA(Ile)-lysidine synthase n=1 Tax=Pseudoruegeria aquimaris TaxID=393663 RepID=A0A1Y5TF34_9RHOB|nr:tRNA lysidine(34) synthetase TilS [Pseudoruegeria aquimaris]SLN62415.1 tRNA(Ile)-lysidine synthase [Pseudoruegeria aquimaris]